MRRISFHYETVEICLARITGGFREGWKLVKYVSDVITFSAREISLRTYQTKHYLQYEQLRFIRQTSHSNLIQQRHSENSFAEINLFCHGAKLDK